MRPAAVMDLTRRCGFARRAKACGGGVRFRFSCNATLCGADLRPLRPARGARPTVELLQVPLDALGVARLRVVRIAAGVPQGAALAQQVPAAVQLDLDRAQALPVLLERGGVGAVGLLARTQLVLLGNELLDAGGGALVAHGTDAIPPECRHSD